MNGRSIGSLFALLCMACGGSVAAPSPEPAGAGGLGGPPESPVSNVADPPPAASTSALPVCSLPSVKDRPNPTLTVEALSGISIKPLDVIAYWPQETVTGAPFGDCHYVPKTDTRSCWSTGPACSTDEQGNVDCGGGQPAPPRSWLRIELTETAAACSHHEAGFLTANENTLVMNVQAATSGSVGLGTYATKGSTGQPSVFAVHTSGSRCKANGDHQLQLEYEHPSFNGSVSISELTETTVSGSIDLSDGQGRVVQATFTAPVCRRTAKYTTCCGS